MKRAESALAELRVSSAQAAQRLRQDAGERQKRLLEQGRKVDDLAAKHRAGSTVVAPVAGRVIEVRAAPGQFAAAGAPLLLLEPRAHGQGGLSALLYVPGVEGKRLHPGMTVEISPSTVKREEYGALRAVVTAVSAFPSTQQAMVADLGNPELVASFLRTIETPIEVRADLIASPDTQSGFAWTSPQGPPGTVEPGTLCQAAITVRWRRPIALVLPILREELGL
jgi:HlyD family secretion protein